MSAMPTMPEAVQVVSVLFDSGITAAPPPPPFVLGLAQGCSAQTMACRYHCGKSEYASSVQGKRKLLVWITKTARPQVSQPLSLPRRGCASSTVVCPNAPMRSLSSALPAAFIHLVHCSGAR